jgi:hypothetical protein
MGPDRVLDRGLDRGARTTARTSRSTLAGSRWFRDSNGHTVSVDRVRTSTSDTYGKLSSTRHRARSPIACAAEADIFTSVRTVRSTRLPLGGKRGRTTRKSNEAGWNETRPYFSRTHAHTHTHTHMHTHSHTTTRTKRTHVPADGPCAHVGHPQHALHVRGHDLKRARPKRLDWGLNTG